MAIFTDLRPIQKVILYGLVQASRAVGVEFYWSCAYGEDKTGIHFSHHFFTPGELSDLRALAGCGLIDLEIFDGNRSAKVTLNNAAFLAARKRFGLDLKHLLLLTAYSVVVGKHDNLFGTLHLARRLVMEEADVKREVVGLVTDGYVEPKGRLHDAWEDLFVLTRAGIAQVEEISTAEAGQVKANIHMGDIFNINDSTVGAVQNRSVNSVQTVTRSRSDTITTINALLALARGQLADVPAEAKQHADEALDNLAEEAKASEPKPSKIRAYASMAVSHVPVMAAFTKTVLEIAQLCNVDPATILHHCGTN